MVGGPCSILWEWLRCACSRSPSAQSPLLVFQSDLGLNCDGDSSWKEPGDTDEIPTGTLASLPSPAGCRECMSSSLCVRQWWILCICPAQCLLCCRQGQDNSSLATGSRGGQSRRHPGDLATPASDLSSYDGSQSGWSGVGVLLCASVEQEETLLCR